MQKRLEARFGSGNRQKAAVDRPVKKQGSRIAKRGTAAVLERMSLDEWDALMAGEISAQELEEKYRGRGAADGTREQADLGRWCA